jgi:hypothetical protein
MHAHLLQASAHQAREEAHGEAAATAPAADAPPVDSHVPPVPGRPRSAH